MSNRMVALAAIAFLILPSCAGKKATTSPGSPQPAGTISPAVARPSESPDCGGESPVWAIPRPKVYLLPGERLYGKTKHGEYLCLTQAEAQGYRPARHPVHPRHHHRRMSST